MSRPTGRLYYLNPIFSVETSGRTSLHDIPDACTAARWGGSKVIRILLITNKQQCRSVNRLHLMDIRYNCDKMKNMFLILSLLIFQFSFGQSGNGTGSKMSRQDVQEFLAHHNQVRAEVGSPGLVWSKELAAYSQEWADHLAQNGCRMEHHKKPSLKGEPVGENLFWGSSATYYHPVDASISWYSEKKIYRYGKFGKGELARNRSLYPDGLEKHQRGWGWCFGLQGWRDHCRSQLLSCGELY